MLKSQLETVLAGQDLAPEAMTAAIDAVMEDRADPVQVGAFLAALRLKGETPIEIAAAARSLRSRSHVLSLSDELRAKLVDTCGTGGDGLDTPNISTMVAVVAASGGLKVAKHGNRSVSSKCGSADLLEALGVPLDPGDAKAAGALEAVGITFLYAPRYHPAMRFVAPVRRSLGVRTLFNILGPLANPLAAPQQVLGVFRRDLTGVLAETLRELGTRRALVIHGDDGMDELTTAAITRGHRLDADEITPFEVDPAALGLSPPSAEALRGGDPETNAAIARAVFSGAGEPAVRDLVALNAAAAFWVGGVAEDLGAGLELARELLDRGAPAATLERWVAYLGEDSSAA